MAGIATALPYIGAAASVVGTLVSARGQQQSSQAQVQQAEQTSKNDLVTSEYEARQFDYLAGQSRAVSQRTAYQDRQSSALLASKALANAAGSGAGASDQNVVNIMNQIYSEGMYRSALDLYEGEDQARSYDVQAQARRLSGKSGSDAALSVGSAAASASGTNMFSTLLSGTASFAGKYGSLFGS